MFNFRETHSVIEYSHGKRYKNISGLSHYSLPRGGNYYDTPNVLLVYRFSPAFCTLSSGVLSVHSEPACIYTISEAV